MKKVARKLVPALAAVLFFGCATNPVNWDSRVGQFSYLQAVSELGPPAKQSQTAEGQTVAEWIFRYYPANTAGLDNDFRYQSAAFAPSPAMTGWRESKLRLTFNTNSLLADWSKD